MHVLTLDCNPRSKALVSRIIDDAVRAAACPDKYGTLALGQCIKHLCIGNTGDWLEEVLDFKWNSDKMRNSPTFQEDADRFIRRSGKRYMRFARKFSAVLGYMPNLYRVDVLASVPLPAQLLLALTRTPIQDLRLHECNVISRSFLPPSVTRWPLHCLDLQIRHEKMRLLDSGLDYKISQRLLQVSATTLQDLRWFN